MTMDPLLGGNYNDVPDTIPKIGAGVGYTMKITGTDIKHEAKSGNRLLVNFVVDQPDNEQKGRRGQVAIFLANPNDDSAEALERRVRTKQFFELACGVPKEPTGGYDRNKLTGMTFKCDVEPYVYTDKSGIQQESRNFNFRKPDGSRF